MAGRCGTSRSQFLGEVRESVKWAIEAVLANANELGLNPDNRTGVYFCLLHTGFEDLAIPPVVIGTVINGKDEKYTRLCKEKVTRLFSMHPLGHALSSQSRDETEEKYGGAVYGSLSPNKMFFFGCSGLSEE